MRYIASLSYGKDSIAMLEAIRLLGYPLDEIVHAEIWATDTIPADFPEMTDFKRHADKIIKERYGLDVTHVCAMKNGEKLTYEKMFYGIPKRRLETVPEGTIRGFPYLWGGWCVNYLKVSPMVDRENCVQYVGIAADEEERIERYRDNASKIMPLVDIGWTEADCMRWCEENNLVAPTYKMFKRTGCWFCHKQSTESLRTLRRHYPKLWKLFMKWDADSPFCFKANNHTLHDYDKRFELEDMGLIDPNRRFRWKIIEMSEDGGESDD